MDNKQTRYMYTFIYAGIIGCLTIQDCYFLYQGSKLNLYKNYVGIHVHVYIANTRGNRGSGREEGRVMV